MIIVIEHFQSLIAIKWYNLRTKLNESLVYRCLKGCKLCLRLLEVLSLNRDCQVSLLLNPLSALNNLLLNNVIVSNLAFLSVKARRKHHPTGLFPTSRSDTYE